ncbi:cyclic nucleotide gated channel 1 [Prunus dulcis]|uniref:Cyclic nucleotide gated channel 1 n=1 Tax=Prunus dulcis TaxID=3755 RepID=A0A4Y1RBD1_PRUDU|nr:cyclic nucleotide gated channel 1 [Prunus dulcis]
MKKISISQDQRIFFGLRIHPRYIRFKFICMAMEHVIINIQKDESEACTLQSNSLGTGSDSVVGQEPSSKNPTPMKTPSSTTAESHWTLCSYTSQSSMSASMSAQVPWRGQNCENAALILRSLSDIPFLIRIMLGAIWYFLSIQRGTICWHEACKSPEGCKAIHYRHEIDTSHSTNNITFLNEKCPINPANAKQFDFGIFLEALQSNTAGQVNFSTKFFYTMWWGFRNMSNYGTDLKTSNYLWENCFAILISAIGLLLFSYLIGNVEVRRDVISLHYNLLIIYKLNFFLFSLGSKQTCMQQLTSTNLLEVEKGKEGEIRYWMSRNRLLEYKKIKMMQT